MYVHTCIFIDTYKKLSLSIHIYVEHICVYTYIHTYTCMFMHIYMHISYIYIYAYIYIFMYVVIYTCMYNSHKYKCSLCVHAIRA